MTLDLDARQRAMLQEMGIAVWAPPPRDATAAAAAPAAAPSQGHQGNQETPHPAHGQHAQHVQPAHHPQDAALQRQATAVDRPGAARPAPVPPAAAQAPAPAQRMAAAPVAGSPSVPGVAASAAAAALVLHEPLAVYPQADPAATPADLGAGWLIVVESTTPHEPLAGDAGKLLDNMLRAMRLHRHPRTLVAALERAQPGAGGEPAAALAQALAAVRPSMVLLLGLGAARAVLGSREPLGRLRAGAHHITGPDGAAVPAVVSYDPAYLLRAPDAKAAAWADLCRALAIVRGAGGRNA